MWCCPVFRCPSTTSHARYSRSNHPRSFESRFRPGQHWANWRSRHRTTHSHPNDGFLGYVGCNMHASLDAATFILAISGVATLANGFEAMFAVAAAMWLEVAIVAIASGGLRSRQPLRTSGA